MLTPVSSLLRAEVATAALLTVNTAQARPRNSATRPLRYGAVRMQPQSRKKDSASRQVKSRAPAAPAITRKEGLFHVKQALPGNMRNDGL